MSLNTEDCHISVFCCRFARYNIYYPALDGFKLSRGVDLQTIHEIVIHNRMHKGLARLRDSEQFGTSLKIGFHALFGEKHDEYVHQYL